MAQAIDPTGIAEIEDKFFLSARGTTVLVLKDGWDGKVGVGHTMQCRERKSRVKAVEFLDGRDEHNNLRSRISVMIDDEQLATDISKGDVVQFYEAV